MAACNSTIELNMAAIIPARLHRRVSLSKKPSTALTQEHEVGVSFGKRDCGKQSRRSELSAGFQ